MKQIDRLIKIIEKDEMAVSLHSNNENIRPKAHQVLYLEDHFYPEVNRYISSNFHQLRDRFRQENFELIYLPSIQLSLEEKEYYAPSDPASICIPSTVEYLESLRCSSILGNLPAIVVSSGHRWDRNIFHGLSIDPSNPQKTFSKFLDLLVSSEIPSLLFDISFDLMKSEGIDSMEHKESDAIPTKEKEERITKRFKKNLKKISRFARGKEEDDKSNERTLDLTCSEWENRIDDFENPSICSIPTGRPLNDKENFLKEESEEEDSRDLQKRAQMVEDLSPEDQETIRHIIDMVKKLRQHRVPQSILSNLIIPEERLSRLLVTKNFQILLPDYNKEVEMASIDKVLYLLLLRHPEGILQKCMTDYVGEMKQIYMKMKNGFLTDRSRCAIENMAFEGSLVDQKLSRIRLAFNSVISKKLARYYIPISGRAVPRRIPLDQSLVEWEEPLSKMS